MTAQKKNILIVIAFVLVIAVVAAVWVFTRPDTDTGDKTITIHVTSPEGKEETLTINTDAEYLWDAMYPDYIDGVDADYGKWVTTVNGDYADDTQGQYWVFTKGGEWVETSCDTTPITDGDTYEFYIYS